MNITGSVSGSLANTSKPPVRLQYIQHFDAVHLQTSPTPLHTRTHTVGFRGRAFSVTAGSSETFSLQTSALLQHWMCLKGASNTICFPQPTTFTDFAHFCHVPDVHVKYSALTWKTQLYMQTIFLVTYCYLYTYNKTECKVPKNKTWNFFLFFIFLPSQIKIQFLGHPVIHFAHARLLIIFCYHCGSLVFFISRSRLCKNAIRSVSLKSNFKSRQMASCIKPSPIPHVQNLRMCFWEKK